MENQQPIEQPPQQPPLPQQPVGQQPPQRRSSLGLKIALLAIVPIIIMAVVAYFIIANNSRPSTDPVAQTEVSNTASLVAEPAETVVAVGDVITLSIWTDTGGSLVNAVQADLNYDPSVFEFVQIDASESAFELEAESSGQDGVIKMARGQIGAVSGRLLVARVQLRALVVSSSTEVGFAQSSVVVGDDSKDILTDITGANLVVESS